MWFVHSVGVRRMKGTSRDVRGREPRATGPGPWRYAGGTFGSVAVEEPLPPALDQIVEGKYSK